ncbi:MAG: hypothetical protein ACTSQK_06480 [Candidatus Heimdallarchaeota archaeon]
MSSQKPANYSVAPSTTYIITLLVFSLIINVILFAIVYFVIDPIVQNSLDPELYSKIMWSIMAFIFFIVFAVVYISINSRRYWIGDESIELINIYRPKKKKAIKYSDILFIRIRKIPILSSRLEIGTILFIAVNDKNKEKIVARFLGIKFPKEMYIELNEKIHPEEKGKKKTADDLLF